MSLFSAEIYTSTILPFRDLFHEGLNEYYENNDYLNKSNIYFLCKIKKVRFVIGETQMLTNNKIGFQLQCSDGKLFYVEKSIFDVSKTASLLKDFSSSQNEFTFQELFKFEINHEKSTPESLDIIVLFVDNNTKTGSFPIDVFHVWGDDDNINFDNAPEIVYVGQSKNILKRFRSHKAVLKAVSALSDLEELMHYFITFKVGYGGHKTDIKEDARVMDIVKNIDRNSKNYWDLIDVLERILIYFFQPKLNELHINTPIEHDSQIQKLLKADGIKGISIGIGVHGNQHSFWSPNQKLKEEFFSYNFKMPENGFTEGLIDELFISSQNLLNSDE